MVILFLFTLLFNNIYLSLGIIAIAFLVAYILTRNGSFAAGMLILVLQVLSLYVKQVRD